MAQYIEYTDGVITFRDGVRTEGYVIDKELTVLGFDGSVNVDWQNIETLDASA
jgi:hypothetical protein